MNKKETVYILGKGEGWDAIKDVPKGSTIYGINDACLRTHEVTHTFHLHDLKDFRKNKVTESSTKLLVDYCKDHPEMPLYTTRHYREFPNAIVYPLEEIVDYFKLPTPYFSSGPEYAIAWAIKEGFKEQYWYGLNMCVHQEYIEQKPGMEFWLGIALGKGIKVHLQHNLSSIMKTKNGLLYGFLTKPWKIY